MTTPMRESTPIQATDISRAVARGEGTLATDRGRTTIADTVVEKIAGLAAREIEGVHRLGAGTARALGAVRERIPGARSAVGQGVRVEVGEIQTAIDIDIVVVYGAVIPELARTVRHNVITAVEGMTGLEVTEVNIAVDDVHLPDEIDGPRETRVQ